MTAHPLRSAILRTLHTDPCSSSILHRRISRPPALLVLLFLAGLAACGSASDDPAQRVEKPVTVAATVPQEK